MNNPKTFGEIIKELREGKGLTLMQVADHLKIDTSLLGKIEKNNRNASNQLVQKIAKFFNVTDRELKIAILSDRVAYEVLDKEELADEVLKVAEKKVKYSRKKTSYL
jgi:HTH-type transcriptional regulator, competence development regulator